MNQIQQLIESIKDAPHDAVIVAGMAEVGPLARSAAVWHKSFVFNFLSIRKVLVLSFWEGR